MPDARQVAQDFWRVRYDKRDVRAYSRYLSIRRLAARGRKKSEIERILRTNNVGKYLRGEKKSFLTNLAFQREHLGPPLPGFQWLPIELKPRGTPGKDWIQVPTEIGEFKDIQAVIGQLSPTKETYQMLPDFGFHSLEELRRDRVNLFGFFLGTMLGDGGKPKKGTARFRSMTMLLMLSKGKPNSLRFGEFASLCANASIGLAMHRIRDAPPSASRFSKAWCYRWLTPASPLIAWTVGVCMGLRDGQGTTSHPVRMEWLLGAPRDFRAHVLQGITESDGFVNAGADRVSFVSSPNTRLFGDLLRSLSVHWRLERQPPIERIEVPTEEAVLVPMFSPRVASHYLEELQLMASAGRFPERERLPDWLIREIRAQSRRIDNYSQICLKLVKKTGYKVSSATVKKYAHRRTLPPFSCAEDHRECT